MGMSIIGVGVSMVVVAVDPHDAVWWVNGAGEASCAVGAELVEAGSPVLLFLITRTVRGEFVVDSLGVRGGVVDWEAPGRGRRPC